MIIDFIMKYYTSYFILINKHFFHDLSIDFTNQDYDLFVNYYLLCM